MSGDKAAETVLPNLSLETIEKIKPAEVVDKLSGLQTTLLNISVDWGIKLLVAILILIVGWTVGNWIHRRFGNMKRLDDTLKNFLGGFFKYVIICLSVVTVIGFFGIPMASLLAVLGAAGLAIGLALQGTLANVASGVMLLILRPFNVGDYIEFGTFGGTVKSLGLFGTELAMADNVYIFAPNSKIWGSEIKNYSRNMMRRQDILVSISYKDDINKAFSVIDRVLAADERIVQDEDKKPQTMVDTMGDFSINVIVRFWGQTSDYWNLRWDITKLLKEELEREGITIPFPTRTVEVIADGVPLTDVQKKAIAAS